MVRYIWHVNLVPKSVPVRVKVRISYAKKSRSFRYGFFRTKIRTTYRTRFGSVPKSVSRTVRIKIRTSTDFSTWYRFGTVRPSMDQGCKIGSKSDCVICESAKTTISQIAKFANFYFAIFSLNESAGIRTKLASERRAPL